MRNAASILLLLFVAGNCARAQSVATDLAIGLARTGEQITQTEAPVVALTAHNRGPVAAGNVVVTAMLKSFALNVSTGVVITVESGCTGASVSEITIGTTTYERVSWPVGALAAGESKACDLRPRARPAAPRTGA